VPAANWGQVRCTRRKIKRQPSRVRNFCQWKKTFFWAYPRQHLTLSHSFVFFPPRWWFCFLCRLIFYIPTDFFYLIGRFFRFTRACRHLQYHRVFFWIFRISAGSSLRQFRLASLFFPGVAGAAWEWLLRGKVRVECLSSWGCQVPVWLPPSRSKPSHPAIECPSCRNKCPSLWPGWKLEAKSQLLVLELV